MDNLVFDWQNIANVIYSAISYRLLDGEVILFGLEPLVIGDDQIQGNSQHSYQKYDKSNVQYYQVRLVAFFLIDYFPCRFIDYFDCM